MDIRKQYLLNIAGAYLNVEIDEEKWNDGVHSIELLEEFLDIENCLTLCVTTIKDNSLIKLKLFKNVSASVDPTVVFCKNRPSILSDNDLISSITITTISGPPTISCYNTVSRVFTPLLLKGDNKTSKEINVERHLNNLETELRSIILSNTGDECNSIAVINSINHEMEYWNHYHKNAKSTDKKVTSAAYQDILRPLSRDFNLLETLPLTEMEDVLENAHNTVDDLWKYESPFPQKRMQNLMELIASDIVDAISKNLSNASIWIEEYMIISNILSQCISTGQKWLASCKELTELFWPNYSLHSWSGQPHIPQSLNNFVDGMQFVLDIRTMHRQIMKLLTSNEKQELQTDSMFKPFRDLDLMNFGPYSGKSWEKAMKQFEYILSPAEQLVAEKLKEQLSYMTTNTRKLLYEFGRYNVIIKRPIVREVLRNERSYFLKLLIEYVKQLSLQLSDNGTTHSHMQTPQIIQDIQNTRQIEAKATEIKQVNDQLLNDLNGYKELQGNINELMKDIKLQHSDLFDTWTSEINALIQNKTLSLRESDPVVQFSDNKLMKVNYSPRLVTLITEVRQLTAMGYAVPRNIVEVSLHAKKFFSYAKTLEQIANFHNTIGDKMIKSQSPMMLVSALALSKLVDEQEMVAWGETQPVERYVQSLKNAVDTLSKENSYLTECHLKIVDKMESLRDVDIIKHFQKWTTTLKLMRSIINQVDQKGYKNLHIWQDDIDRQLFKILESQYVKSLDNVHLYLPEIHCELVYRNGDLEFSPNEEQLKIQYGLKLKAFLEIPKHFRGVGDNNNEQVYEDIKKRHADDLENITNNTMKIFEQLQGVKKHWKSWITIDKLDTKKLSNASQWDLHFRASKVFGQEISKLPTTEEKVGCFIVGLSRLKSDLEYRNRSNWDELVNSLKESILEDVAKLQQYVDDSTATLNKQPVTMEQIDETDASFSNILQERPNMESLYKIMNEKTEILSSWSRERIDAGNRLLTAWERLNSLLDNYQHIIAKQVEMVKTTLSVSSQNLNHEIERFYAKWELTKTQMGTLEVTESIFELYKYLELIRTKVDEWKEVQGQSVKIRSDYEKFNIGEVDFPLLDKVSNELTKETNKWSAFEEFYDDFDKLKNVEWIVFRRKLNSLSDFLQTWQEKLLKIDNNTLVTRLLQEIHKYQDVVPILNYLKGDDLTNKHWTQIYAFVGIDNKPVDSLLLADLLIVSNKLIDNSSEIQDICKKAASEVIIRQALAELDQWDVQTHFDLFPQADSKGKELFLVKEFKNVMNQIGDNQSLLQSIKTAADYEMFSERSSIWERKLVDLDEFITMLANIQRKWTYLEPIFGSNLMGQERVRFDRVDQDFKNVMKYIKNNSRVSGLCKYPNIKSLLENSLDQLKQCQKSLDEFLQNKRKKFSRFLFLGDDDLLEVIGQSSKEDVIQLNLKKIFAGINSIVLSSDGKEITSICSAFGEIVSLNKGVNVGKPVEEWMNDLVVEMQISLKKLLQKCLQENEANDPTHYPSQILCLANSILFTTKCEKAIKNMTLSSLLDTYKTQLKEYTTWKLENSNLITNNKADIMDIKLKALLLDTISQIDVVSHLINNNVVKLEDWNWQKQFRYYCNSSGQVTVKMANACIDYSFEYVGNQQKLVRTPLTERCFIALCQGIHLGMGGNPYGPAGTGKTETVKALGSLLGRQVLVFNCDKGIDSISMGRILTGLVRSGAWGCFDEFNRLDEATLSAVSMYIQVIQDALQSQTSTVKLLGNETLVDSHCAIFVTMNPVGAEYGGRNKLPDNLKQLFRPIAMSYPDHEQIGRTLLYCDGFNHAEVISKKLIELFSCAKKLLSHQHHYDWGLRAFKAVVNACSSAVQLSYKQEVKSSFSLENELEIVIQAIKLDTCSKLTYSDNVLFKSLIDDIFPGVSESSELQNKMLKEALISCCQEMDLKQSNRQIEKCLEMFEQLQQRMGMAIVGPASSGKSTIRNLLLKGLQKIGKSLRIHTVNPKSMPKESLFGSIDLNTRQWTDGVITSYGVQVIAEPSDIWSWIVCDGDIDPDWVESLNSVMDDNRLLTLPSGWRIQFGANVNFIFETSDLSHASPATISRMGVVYLSEEDSVLEDYLSQYMENYTLPKSLIETYFMQVLDWCCNEAEFALPSSKLSIARTALSFMHDVNTTAQFAVALIHGFGSQVTGDFKGPFATQVFNWTRQTTPSDSTKCKYMPDLDAIDSYYDNLEYSIEYPNSTFPLVKTATILLAMNSIENWLNLWKDQHFLLVGPSGSAKTLLLDYILLKRNDIDKLTIYCGSTVSPHYVMKKIQEYCIIVSSNNGRVYKPKKGKLIVHFKNLHILKPDEWGTNMLLAFLQQLITYGGFFDQNLEWINTEGINIVGTLSNCSSLPLRFTSILHTYSIEPPTNNDFVNIYTTYLNANFKSQTQNHNNLWHKDHCKQITNTMVTIYNEVRSSFPSVKQLHYSVCPHDLTKWFSGLLRYKQQIGDSESHLIEAISYDAMKLFGDKLVNNSDKLKLSKIITKCFRQSSSDILDNAGANYFIPAVHSTSLNNITPLTKLNKDDWITIVNKNIKQYERDGEILNLEIIDELLLLTASICRIVTNPGGSCLLVGSAGVGRKSAIKIISAYQNAKIVQPLTLEQPYLNNCFKMSMQYAGIEDQQVYLVLEDHIIDDNKVLDAVNMLMSSGEIPGLYSDVEMESISASVKNKANDSVYNGSVREYYNTQIQNNVHILVLINYENKCISNIMQNAPAFIQKSTIIWLDQWNQNTIDKVPKMIIAKLNENMKDKQSIIDSIDAFGKLQEVLEKAVISPNRYIHFIKTYIELYKEKKRSIIQKQQTLEGGISKLNEASNIVSQLRKNASIQQEKLAEKQEKANNALDMISNTMKNANVHKDDMEALKGKTEIENEQLKSRKEIIEKELEQVEPLIQQSQAAVGNIRPESLSEIRSLRAPPDTIRDILEGVLRLMGIQDTSWNSMKTFLAKRGVKEEIRSFDAGRITVDNRKAVQQLLQIKSSSFEEKTAKRASLAAAPLADWVKANVKYAEVVEKIRPLEREQNKLKENLKSATLQLDQLSAGLLDVDATVAKLKEQLTTYTKEATSIEIDLTNAQETLKAAEGLVDKLNDEYERWQEQVQEMSNDLVELPKHCLLAAGFITYLANETENIRKEVINKWMHILYNRIISFNVEQFLSTERDQMQWQSQGLPTDPLSVQNVAIILNTISRPLILDSTSAATNWLKATYKDKNMECISFNSNKFRTTLELAIRFGKPLLIEEVEVIDPILFPLLRFEFINQGLRVLVNLSGKLVDYHPDFQLFLSGRNLEMKMPPNVNLMVNVVNFITTKTGLSNQLMISTIKQEKPHLEENRKKLLKEKEELQEKLFVLQNELLRILASSSGDILQNKPLLSSLNETKASSVAITQALEESNKIQSELDKEYELYKDVSHFGSSLYFATADFAKDNVLYILSVNSFKELFLKALLNMNELKSTNFKQHLISNVYQYIGCGIFKSDRLSFLLNLCRNLFPAAIPQEEWNVFMENFTEVIKDNGLKKIDLPTWMSESHQQPLLSLQANLSTLYTNMDINNPSWQQFLSDPICESKFPAHCNLTEFQKVVIIKTLRKDRIFPAIKQLINNLTGLRSINVEVPLIHDLYKVSKSDQPILIVITSGNDPSKEIQEVAKNVTGTGKYIEIAMGLGQENNALASLEQLAGTGGWLILKNLHLVPLWLPILNQTLQYTNKHDDFRLWLITEQTALFNPVLSQNCMKVAFEAPEGIKSNLIRILSSQVDIIKNWTNSDCRIFFSLAILHAIAKERMNYIPLGWSTFYDFNDTDLKTITFLSREIWGKSPIQWPYIIGLYMEAVYGARMENKYDCNILTIFLKEYLSDDILSHRWKPLNMYNPLPSTGNIKEYANSVFQIQSQDWTSFCDLPMNIKNAKEKKETMYLLKKVKDLEVNKNLNRSQNIDYLKEKLTPLLILWKKLNQGHDFLKVSVSTDDNYAENSLLTNFIQNEYHFGIQLVQSIHADFAIINRIYKGSITMEDGNDSICQSFLLNETPSKWRKQFSGPSDITKYLRIVIQTCVQITQRKMENLRSFQNLSINLGSFFRPEAFIVSFKQDYSRNHSIPMDELELETTWEATEGSVLLTGLLLEGALFDVNGLSTCTATTPTVNNVRQCYLSWQYISGKSRLDNNNYINIPLYNSSTREKQITTIRLTCSHKEKDKWIKAAVAMFLYN